MANEKRLIDANALLAKMRKTSRYFSIKFDIEEAPTVDAVEVVHGHWTSTGIFSKRAGYGVRYYQHAECEVAPCRLFECEHDYCPNCGAKMDGDGNG